MSESRKYQPVTKTNRRNIKNPVAPEEEKTMSETKKYQPTASIKRSKREPRLVTAKGKTYQVTQYGITKENFLKLCRELKEFGMENVKYVNFDVWEQIFDVAPPADKPADQPADLPF